MFIATETNCIKARTKSGELQQLKRGLTDGNKTENLDLEHDIKLLNSLLLSLQISKNRTRTFEPRIRVKTPQDIALLYIGR